MMKKKELKIMRADIDLGAFSLKNCTIRAYRDDADRSVVVFVPSKAVDVIVLGHNGTECFYVEADAHVLIKRDYLFDSLICVTSGNNSRSIDLFEDTGACVVRRLHDETAINAYGYDVEVKPDTPLYSHDDCERMSEYDKVYFLLTQAETR